MSKLYNFNNRKYQHNVEFAMSRLAHLADSARKAGKEAQASYYDNKRRELCERASILFGANGGSAMVQMPYEDWEYLMAVKDWAVEQGSGCGYF